jgi:hypothetical protein
MRQNAGGHRNQACYYCYDRDDIIGRHAHSLEVGAAAHSPSLPVPAAFDRGDRLGQAARRTGIQRRCPPSATPRPPIEHCSLPALLAHEDHVPGRSLHPPTPSSVLAAVDFPSPRSPHGRTSFELPPSVTRLRAYTSSVRADKIYMPLPARHPELAVEPKLAYTSTWTATCACRGRTGSAWLRAIRKQGLNLRSKDAPLAPDLTQRLTSSSSRRADDVIR